MNFLWTETDLSEVINHNVLVSPLIVVGNGPSVSPKFIGKFPLTHYYSLSHCHKVEFKKNFKSGEWQRKEYMKAFGDYCLADPT